MPKLRVQDIEVTESAGTSWIWRNRVPQYRTTVVNGDWGAGKTTAICAMIADVFNNEEFPDGEVPECQPGHVLFITTESDQEEIGQKLIAQGMTKEDIEKYIHVVDYIIMDNGELGTIDIDRDRMFIEETFKVYKPWLVVWDPFIEFHSRKEIDSKSIRGLMVVMHQMCQKHRTTMLVLIHWNKNEKLSRRSRMAGSQQYAAAVKNVITVYRDDKNKDLRHFFQEKNNLGPEPAEIGYVIDKDGVLVWGKVDSPAPPTPKIEEAKQWILAHCQEPKLVQECIKQSGFSERTLKRARALLGKQVLTKELYVGAKMQAHWEVVGELNMWGALEISLSAPGVHG